MFTPPSVSRKEGPIATLTMGAQGAATNWPGGSYDPETHIALRRVADLAAAARARAAAARRVGPAVSPGHGADRRAALGRLRIGRPRDAPAAPVAAPLTVQGLPLVKPPYSRITAIDLTRASSAGRCRTARTPDIVRNHPALKGLNLPPTGRPGNNVGTLVTKTLVIAGEGNFGPTPSGTRGAMLRAYDKATGKEVAACQLPAPQTGSPMTYMLNGRQYLVIAISGPGYSGELLALRAPAAGRRRRPRRTGPRPTAAWSSRRSSTPACSSSTPAR